MHKRTQVSQAEGNPDRVEDVAHKLVLFLLVRARLGERRAVRLLQLVPAAGKRAIRNGSEMAG